MSEHKLQKAIRNNRALYTSVFSANGLELQSTATEYFLLEESPPLYSNLVTCSPESIYDETIKSIDTNFEKEQWQEWSVKDSFNMLDLSNYGFSQLFDAEWFYLHRQSFQPSSEYLPIDIRCISDPGELERWIELWGEGPEIGNKIFNNKLLQDPTVTMLIYSSSSTSGVALLNQEVNQPVGISNFFPDKPTITWSYLLSYIFENFDTDEVVGYESADIQSKISALGVETVGPLSVWLKKRAT